jgi:hypothetical protein
VYIPFWLFPYLSHIKKKEIFIMRKEQITVTNNSVCNSAENKGLEGKGREDYFILRKEWFRQYPEHLWE